MQYPRFGSTLARRGLHATAILIAAHSLGGCAVVTVASTAVSVAATAVEVTATVVETTVDVTAAGVKAATGSNDQAPPAQP